MTTAAIDPTVAALQRELDANPDNHECRRVLADAVTEAGGDGRGYLALSLHRRHPTLWEDREWSWWCLTPGTRLRGEDARYRVGFLPADWWQELEDHFKGGYRWSWKDYRTRTEAEEAAAAAFLRLPLKRQTQILKGRLWTRATNS